jgi:polyisoprenoid-binding protein YceI
MMKKIALVFGLVGVMVVLGAAAYYRQLTAPVNVSDIPPAAVTMEAGSTPPGTGVPSAEAAQVYHIDPAQSEASYRVDETFFDMRGFVVVTGTTKGVAGDVLVDKANPPASRIGEIVVDVSQLRTDEPDRDNAIRRGYLESSTYPLATFRNTTVSGLPSAWKEGASLPIKITGEMTVRDVTQKVTWDAEVVLDGPTLRGRATTALKMSRFGISPPNLSMLKVEDDIALTLNLWHRPHRRRTLPAPAVRAPKPQDALPARKGQLPRHRLMMRPYARRWVRVIF